jgi:hypothetical protein
MPCFEIDIAGEGYERLCAWAAAEGVSSGYV